MKSIEFTDSEIAELRIFYQQQLEKTLKKIETIKGILNKINADEKKPEEKQLTSGPSDTPEISEKELAEPITPSPFDTLQTRKVGRTKSKKKKKKLKIPKWGTFILDLLKQHDKPIKLDDFVEEAIYKFKIPEDENEKVRKSIIYSSFILRNHHKKTRNLKVSGEKGIYYALTSWFDKNGKLKEKYKEKLTQTLKKKPKTKARAKKKGRAKKPVWVPFVLNTIKEKDTLLQSKTLTNIAMEELKIDESDYKKTRVSISSCLKEQVIRTKKLKSYAISGIIGKFYGLSEWFDKNGELKEKYKEKLTQTLTEKPKHQKKVTGKQKEKNKIWVPFVLNKIKELDMLVQAKTLTDLAMKKFNVNRSDYEKTRIRVATALSKLEKERKKLKTYSKEGTRGKFYGLSEWFDNQGGLTEQYLDRQPEKIRNWWKEKSSPTPIHTP